jgi:hypothetical protein
MTALAEDELTGAIRHIRGLAPDAPGLASLADALDDYCSALTARGLRPLCVVDSYPFGQLIFNEGIPLRSNPSEEFEPALLQESEFPLGIIIKGYAEVTAYGHGAGTPRPVSQAILKPGDFIGAFEFMDFRAGVRPKPIPDWMMTAGSASIRCAFRTDNDSFVKHVVRRFQSQRRNSHLIREASTFLDQMKNIEPINKLFNKCRTDILYFGRDWFSLSLQDYEDDIIRTARSKLNEIICLQAWRSSARLMPSASRAAAAFFKGNSGGIGDFTQPERHERQRGITIFNSLYDMFFGRRPMFIPERNNGGWGPIKEICDLLHGYNDDDKPFILRPDYLSDKDPIGFMPLESIGSDLVEGGGAREVALTKTLNTIYRAAKGTGERNILKEYGNIIRALSARLPAEKKSGQTTGAVTCVTWDERYISPKEISEDQFFKESGISLRRPGAEFFKTCIRLNRAPTSDPKTE